MNDFSRQDIASLKAKVDLVEVMRAEGLELQQVGVNLLCRCPWHDDKEASLVVNPEKQLYNCFGCEAKGDVLTFIQETRSLSFREAVLCLADGSLAGGEFGGSARSEAGSRGEQAGRSHVEPNPGLLKRVAEHYQRGLAESEEARRYLAERGLGDVEALRAFGVGYCDGSLLKTVPKGSETRQTLVDLGVLDGKGKEHFLGCVVVPLEHPELGTVGFYGRRINPKAKVRHLFLPGPKRGVLNWQALRSGDSVYLTEGVLDALSLWVAGVRNVSCLHGTAGLTPALLEALNASNVRELNLCVDADRAGDEAVERIAGQVQGRFKLSRVLLPAGTDPNSILVDEGPDSLRTFLDCHRLQAKASEPAPSGGAVPLTETTDTNFTLTFDSPPVCYTVTPLPPFTGRLRVSLRGVLPVDGEGRPKRFLDRLDLTSARARGETVKGLCRALELEPDMVEAHLDEVMRTTEMWADAESSPDAADSNEPPVLTEEQKLQALEFLQAPNLVRRLQDDMEALGYVGEGKGKLLAYLIGLSRKLENPLSGIIRSQSGAGKSGLSSLVAKLTPPEDVVHYSRVSAHALAYAPKDAFKRKLVIMEERVGGEAADYYIRILQSSHQIRQAVVIKDPATGQMRTQEFEVEGPIAYLETTTDRHLNQENASRCFEIYLDETEEQTRRIHDRQRRARTLERLKKADQQAILERHHNAQRLLEEVKIVIPYVDHLTFPTKWLRTRRDNERFLCLIEASAFLHQFQRVRKSVRSPQGEVFYVEAALDDYRLAYELAKDVLGDTLHELSISAREALQAASSLGEGSFTRRDLRAALSWSQKRIHQAVHELLDMEYLTAVGGNDGKAHRYSVVLEGDQAQTNPVLGLLHPDTLEQRLRGEMSSS